MKKLLLSLFLAGMIIPAFTQSSKLVVFSENGERFQVVLNGVLQNADPETNVLIKDLIAPSYKLKVLFEAEIPDLDKTIYFQNGSSQDTYMIKTNRKGEYVLRFQNSVPMAQAPPPPPTQIVHVYSATPPTSTVVTQTTTTTTAAPVAGSDVEMNANVNGMNMNVSISETSTSTVHTATTTTTSSSGLVTTEGVATTSESVYVLPGYNGYYGCPYPMDDNDFQMAKQSITSKDFSDSKLTIAKQVLDNNCLLSGQVKEIIMLFDFEDDKLEIAKYAYGSTLDIGNYFKINDAFEFESTIEELDEYIAGYRR